ncbi:MAG: PorV/PorQ family protein, partial [Bacteroidetes bacterium]|nr:PorV/PorQ family protein [Bacteroidota bacterium]
PVGARYLAMSGAPIANVSGLEGIYWNPAGVDFSQNSANAIFSNRSYIADISINYVAASGRLGDIGSVGLSFRSFNIGDIHETTMDYPDGTGAIFNPTYFVLGLTYSKQLTDRIGVGANFNLVNETIDRVSATGFSFDFGVQYRDLLFVKGLDLGIVVKNYGSSMKFSGNALYRNVVDPNADRGPTYLLVDAATAELPSEIGIGLSYEYKLNEDNVLNFAAAFQNNNYTYDNYKFGAEYTFQKFLSVRGGYLMAPQASTNTPDIYEGVSFGAGINFKQFSGLDLTLDYAYVPVKYFDANHVFAISLGF